jgi:hypothetical protein
MAEIPECRNYRLHTGACARSDVVVKEEQDEAWVLFCRCCELVMVVSKDGLVDRSRFENSLKRQRQQEALTRLWAKRRKFFT